jgi:hypothetical protein
MTFFHISIVQSRPLPEIEHREVPIVRRGVEFKFLSRPQEKTSNHNIYSSTSPARSSKWIFLRSKASTSLKNSLSSLKSLRHRDEVLHTPIFSVQHDHIPHTVNEPITKQLQKVKESGKKPARSKSTSKAGESFFIGQNNSYRQRKKSSQGRQRWEQKQRLFSLRLH